MAKSDQPRGEPHPMRVPGFARFEEDVPVLQEGDLQEAEGLALFAFREPTSAHETEPHYIDAYFIDPRRPYQAQLSLQHGESIWTRIESGRNKEERFVELHRAIHEGTNVVISAVERITTTSSDRVIKVLRADLASLQAEHAELQKSAEQLTSKVSELLKDIRELRAFISEKYSASSLFLGASAATFASVASLVAWYWYDVTVLHPVLAVLMLVTGIGFAALSGWKHRCSSESTQATRRSRGNC